MVVIVALVVIILCLMAWWLNRPSTASARALKGSVSPSWSIPTPGLVARSTGAYQGLCDGSELFCLSAESGQPAETLRQLAGTLSVESTRRYQIHLTITPLEDDPTPVGEAPVPASPPAVPAP